MVVAVADFELKAAFIEGAKAARDGLELLRNPFAEIAKRESWNAGYRTVRSGCLEAVSYAVTPESSADWGYDNSQGGIC